MRVVVSGAAGFVGTRLVSRLEARGDTVAGFDRELDVADGAAVAAFFERHNPEAVIHLAARSSVAASFEDAEAVFRVNYLGTRSILEATRCRAPRARVILVGSGECYGVAADPVRPFDEGAPLRPGSPYARAKAAADLLGAAYAGGGLAVVRVRPFPHTGPGQSDTFAASSFARQIAELELGRRDPPIRVGALDAVRDYLDVDDVVEAYLRLLDPSVPLGIYNVARGEAVPIRRLLEGLLERATSRFEVVVDPARLRAADASIGDATRLRQVTGWAPRIPLEDTLGRLIDDWRARVRASP